MTPAIGVDFSRHLAYSTLERGRQQSLGYQIRLSLYLLIPEVGGEITLEYAT